MDSLYFYLNITALICGIAALAFGVSKIVRKSQGTYFSITLMALGTLTLGFLFCFVFRICGGSSSGFSLGFLSMLGSFLFLLTANRSYISVLEDAPTSHRRRATRIALVLPALSAAVCVMIVIKRGPALGIIPPMMLCVATGFCMFFSFREVLLPDVKNGFIDCMRPYNITVCVFSLSALAMELADVYSAGAVPFIIIAVIGDASVLCLVLFLWRGIRKWKT